MRKGSALILGAVIAFVTVFPVDAGSITFDPAGGSSDAVVAVESAISTFESSFSAKAGCIGSASVVFEVLSGRKGEYRTAEAVVAVNPEREVSSMRATVYHELGHHLMLTCRAYRDSAFTDAFFAAQGIPAGTGWFDAASGWSSIPAEHFAEAAVMIVQGSTDGRIPLSAGAVDVLQRWLNGQAMPAAVTPAPETPTVEETEEVAEPAPVPVVEVVESPVSVEPSHPAETENAAPEAEVQAPEAEVVNSPNTTVVLAAAVTPPDQSAVPVDEAGRSDCPTRAFRCGWLRPV